MLSPSEIVVSVRAVVDLALGRPNALQRLDTSYAGFWRSFLVAILLAPFYVVMALAQREMILESTAMTPDLFPVERFTATMIVVVVAEYVLFPLGLAVLARPLDLTRRYVPLVVAYNWLKPLVTLPVTLVFALYLGGIIARNTTTDIVMILSWAALGAGFLVLRRILGDRNAVAAGLIVMDFLLSALVGVLFSYMLAA
ncbi:hypothetical protein [Methylobrevis pamukkalensis]|uniref:Yip1 domain protein n=1 Tax=Methylobrevis pamukkalensis TaxID=1439726 RepID=A0A1E3H3H3_9HYPH|nr:hypothetical protein [Methylobrevis pamukkalensis]ODN70346.1 hypothetical protein A6302_02324 [Methylobrevis pamukkalensis]